MPEPTEPHDPREQDPERLLVAADRDATQLRIDRFVLEALDALDRARDAADALEEPNRTATREALHAARNNLVEALRRTVRGHE